MIRRTSDDDGMDNTGTMVFKDKNGSIDSGSSDGYSTLVSHQYDTMVSNRNNDTIVATGHSSVPLYVVFEREVREFKTILLSHLIDHRSNAYSNITKYLTRASRSNTGTWNMQ